MKKIVTLILILFSSIYTNAQNDTIIQKSHHSVDEFYRTQFSVFDTLRVVNDTIFLAPVLIEQKIVVQDSIAVTGSGAGFQKVVLSSYEVARRSTSRDVSYFLISPEYEMFYNRIPRSNYSIPYDAITPIRREPSYWTKKNILALDFNQGTFTNWNAGGVNSISGIVKGDFGRKYERGRFIWASDLRFRYGLNKQEEIGVRKTDDVLTLNSTFGYKTSVKSNWYQTAKFTLNTQMADGFAYPDTENPISRAFAPAYMFLGIGAEYAPPKTGFLLYLSPATWKATYVFDRRLANMGVFGLQGATLDTNGNVIADGPISRHEFGFLVTNNYAINLMKNVRMEHKLVLYTDYLNNFGNIDVDWQLQFQMKVNNFINATLGGHLIYDDDINNVREVDGMQVTEGPRVQLKQLLAVGITFSF